jgi:hypothetical protein
VPAVIVETSEDPSAYPERDQPDLTSQGVRRRCTSLNTLDIKHLLSFVVKTQRLGKIVLFPSSRKRI